MSATGTSLVQGTVVISGAAIPAGQSVTIQAYCGDGLGGIAGGIVANQTLSGPLAIGSVPFAITVPAACTPANGVVLRLVNNACACNNSTANLPVTLKVDITRPTIVCPANISVSAGAACNATVNYTAPVATDDCALAPGSPVLQSGLASGSTFPVGISTVVWRATDAAGLTKTCSFRVIVLDAQAPTFTCPTAPVVLNTPAGVCTATATYTAPTATDNCTSAPTVTRISGPAPGTPLAPGNYTVVFRATDASGRTSTCQLQLQVRDNLAPGLTCPPNIVRDAAPNVCCTSVTYAIPTPADNCPGSTVIVQSGLVSGSLFFTGVNTVVLRATDAAGNTTTCAFTVTINDTQSPILVCPPNTTVSGSGTPCGYASNQLALPTVQENCTLTSLTSNAPTRLVVGTTPVTWTAMDASGLVGTCTHNVTVLPCATRPGSGAEDRGMGLEEEMVLKANPNPAVSSVVLSWSGVRAGRGELVLYDALGRAVWSGAVRTESGVQAVDISAAGIPAGLYRVALRTDSEVRMVPLVVIE